MRFPSLSRRAVLGAILSTSLLGLGVIEVAHAADAPTAGCTPTYTDPAGDAAAGDPSAGPVTGDDDLDIVGVLHTVEGDVFTATQKITKLSDLGPSNANGDRFIINFTVAKKAVIVTAERDFGPGGTKKATVSVGGTAASFPVTLVEDIKNSMIGASFKAADLEKAVGTPLAGQAFSAMTARTAAFYPSNASPATLNTFYDTATAPATAHYAFGESCHGGSAPAPSASGGASGSDTATATITISAPARIQTSDPEPVTATLKDGKGNPMSGKRITAQVGAGKAVAGTTNSSGQVKLRPVVIDRAGTRALVVRYAGASDGSGKAEKRQNVTVVAEVSKIATKTSGTGSTRTFTITLTDDDPVRHPYAGATLTVAYSGRTVSVKTDSAGHAVLKLRSGTRVDIRYAGRSGYVQAATARTTV